MADKSVFPVMVRSVLCLSCLSFDFFDLFHLYPLNLTVFQIESQQGSSLAESKNR